MSDDGKLVCDFCGSTDVTWEYPAQDFMIGIGGIHEDGSTEIIGVGSDGSWASCDACHDLIERGDKDGVLARTIATSEREGSLRSFPDLRGVLEKTIVVVHKRFYASRTGPSRPIAVA